MGRDVWNTVKQRPGWSGILLCISPVGTAAAMQVFTSFSDSYHASPRMVTWVNGYGGGLLTGIACLLGGWICDRMNRRAAYLLSGALTAAIALVMAFSPMTPFTYAWAALTYLFVTGFCYAAFTAFVLQCVGGAQASASTQYTLFTSAGNFAIFYVGKIDGMGFDWYASRFGEAGAPRGLLVTDGALNLIGIALFLGLLALLKPQSAAEAPVAAKNA
jgi:MFS family permease